MSFDTYDNLKKAVLKQTHRNDLLTKFDDFLAIAEVEMRSSPAGALKMNTQEQIITDLTSTSSKFLPLPVGFQSSRKFNISIYDTNHVLEFRTPDQLVERPSTGIPCFFTVTSNQIKFDVLPSEEFTITITYNADLLPLSATNQTNDALVKYPNIYLYGCLKQAFIFSEDLDMSSTYDGLFSEAIVSANMSEEMIKYPTQPQETVAWAP